MADHRKFRAFYLPLTNWVGQAVALTYPPNGQPIPELSEVNFVRVLEKFEMRVARDGMVMLHLSEYPDIPLETDIEQRVRMLNVYVEHMNAFLLLLDTVLQRLEDGGSIDVSEVTRADICTVVYYENQPIPAIAATGFNASFVRAGYRFSPPSAGDHFWISYRSTISSNAMEQTVVLFSHAIEKDGLISALASLTKGISEYKVGNYALAIVLSWFVVESSLRQLWRRVLDQIRTEDSSASPRINGDRLRLLTGNNYSIAAISNTLELMEIISPGLFQLVNDVRQKRNKIAHVDGDYVATTQDAQQAIQAASEMVKAYFDLDVSPSLGFSVSG